ncbi:hypothetical protein [Streptomyces sp. NPDC055632]
MTAVTQNSKFHTPGNRNAIPWLVPSTTYSSAVDRPFSPGREESQVPLVRRRCARTFSHLPAVSLMVGTSYASWTYSSLEPPAGKGCAVP